MTGRQMGYEFMICAPAKPARRSGDGRRNVRRGTELSVTREMIGAACSIGDSMCQGCAPAEPTHRSGDDRRNITKDYGGRAV